MKYYKKFLDLGCFTFSEAQELIGKKESALSLLSEYIKRGLVAKVRRGLYVALEKGFPVVERYEIACKIAPDAVIAYHTAFTHEGCANQIAYCVYVATETRFRPFEYEGYTYMRAKPTIKNGVVNLGKVSITDAERTVLDCIDNFYMCLGFEEFCKCLNCVLDLDEQKLCAYLQQYNKKVLYQKVGFVFDKLGKEHGISNAFLEHCKENSGQLGYLLPESKNRKELEFNKKWNLMVPQTLWRSVTKYEEDYYEL